MSTDGGSVWNVKDLYYADGGDFICDRSNNTTFWCGGRYYDPSDSLYKMSVSKTTNTGDSWTRYTIGSSNGYLYAMAMDPGNSNIVYAGGYESGSAIYRTTNSGGSWTKLPATGLSGYVYALAIDSDNTNIMYAGTSSNLYKSTNSGSTWATTGFSGGRTNTILIDNTSTDATMIYAGTYSNGVYRSTNNGSSWEPMNDGLGGMNINCLDVNPNNYIFAGTNGSSTYRWSLLVGAEESKEESIGRFVFFAKPNPAKRQTVLNFQLTRETAVELSIYDIQGRLVKNLISDIKQAGTHKISWDGLDGKDNRVSAGIYFCRLKTENTDYLEKLILVK